MMSQFNAIVSIQDKGKVHAVFDSISADNMFYPENPTKTKISLKKDTLQIEISSNEIAHLRANINSTLRLVQASSDSIETLKI